MFSFWLCCALWGAGQDPEMMGLPQPSSAPVLARAPVGRYQMDDFYYTNEKGQKIGLVPTNKLLLVFHNNATKEARVMIFSRFQKFAEETLAGVVGVENFQSDSFVVELLVPRGYEASPGVKALDIANVKNKELTVLPVFILEEQEVSLTNSIEIVTNSAIGLDRLIERLQNEKYPLGDFKIKNIEAVSGRLRTYILEVSDLQWPPNILVLANLINDQGWVESARPVFRFLSEPVSVAIWITPTGTPTLGERMTLNLDVKINNSKMKILADQVPQLGAGEFVFLGLDDVFFKAEKGEHQMEKLGAKEIWHFRWPFSVYAVGDYPLKNIQLPFEGFAFPVNHNVHAVVTSVTQGAQPFVADIQAMKYFSPDSASLAVNPNFAPKHFSAKLELECMAMCVLVFAGLMIAVGRLSLLFGNKSVGLVNADQVKRESIVRALDALRPFCTKVGEQLPKNYSPKFYEGLELALRDCLEPVFGLGKNVLFDDLKNKHRTNDEEVVFLCLQELRRRHDKNYHPDPAAGYIFDGLWLTLVQKKEGGHV